MMLYPLRCVAIVILAIKCVQCDNGDAITDTWEGVHMICPNQCVCQRSPFMDLSIARWIQGMRREKSFETTGIRAKYTDTNDETAESNLNNDVFSDDEDNQVNNEFVKFVMCMLQGDGSLKDIVMSLPQDLQGLVLLHNGNVNSNFTVATSDLIQFPELTTLEIRGTGKNRNLHLFIDEPLPTLRHGNFESIELMADEQLSKMHSSSPHPSQTYDYVPESERFTYNVSVELAAEVEIVSYDVYRMERERSRKATFIGWTLLEVLRIHNCQFDEIYWEMFDGLVNLRHLSLENNAIKVIPSFAFYGALHITTLSLARNNILDLHYRALAGLLDLKYLDLTSNNLTKLSEITFPPFPSLEVVDLRHNPIQYIFPMTFGVMNNTRELLIGSETVPLELSIGSGSLMGLDRLRSLSVMNITTPVLNQALFTGLSEMRRLKFRGSIKRIEFDAFAEMPKLQEIILSDCSIFEISMDAFFGVKDLRVIDLSRNQLFFIPPGLFDEQKQLKEIYLQQNNLKKLPKRFFENSAVKLIRLTENPWVCSCDMLEWKQAITNHVRSTKVSPQLKSNCYVNPKTGKLEGCDMSAPDAFPQYSYEFDNRMSPRCNGGPEEMKYRSVYYTLRHSLKCRVEETATPEINVKENIQPKKWNKITKKVPHTPKFTKEDNEKLMRQQNMIPMVQMKAIRRQSFENKVRKTLFQRSKLQREHVLNDTDDVPNEI